MAVGSNSLGLLFKIGVDASDAEKAFRDLMANNAEFRKDVEDGMKAEMQAFAGVGTAIKSTAPSFNQAINQVTDFRQGIQGLLSGNIGSGLANLGKSMGGVGLAIGAALAALAVEAAIAQKAFSALLQTAEDVATKSKEDFDELKQSVERVGGAVTETDRKIAGNLTKSVTDLHAVFTSLIVDVMRQIGPPLIVLIQNIGKEILLLRYPLEFIGGIIRRELIGWAITFQLLALETQKGFKGLLPSEFAKSLIEARRLVREALDKPLPEVPFAQPKDTKGVDEEERLRRVRIALIEANSVRELQIYEHTRDQAILLYRGQAINAVEATAIEEFARKKLRTALEDNAAKIEELDKQANETAEDKALREQESANKQVALNDQLIAARTKFNADLDKADAEQRKFDEARLKRIDEILKGEKEIGKIVEARAKVAPPGAPLAVEGQVPGLPSDADIQAGLDKALKHYQSFWYALQAGFQNAGQRIQKELSDAIENLPYNLIHAFTDSFKDLLDAFIRTGETGPGVMKQFTAAVLKAIAQLSSTLAAASFAAALWFLAWGDYFHAAIATAAGIGFTAIAVALGYVANKIAPSQASNAAGGGGFGGTSADQPPGTITINQGAGSSLGIQAQTLAVMTGISNMLSTASPGDVVTRGSEQNPVAIGQANNEAARRDGSVSREFLQISGLRTA